MELLTSIIDIESIQVKKSSFSPEQKATQIEALANTIIELGGLINIPVIKQNNIDNYELISGHLEYFAYLKAREINPRLPDRLTVFVSNTRNQAAISKQLEILQLIDNTKQSLPNNTTSTQVEIDLKLNNLESFIHNNNKILFEALEQQKTELLLAIESKIPQQTPPMDAFNRILEPEIAFQVQRKLELILNASKSKKIVSILQEISKTKGHKQFQTFSDILERLKQQQKGLISQAKMIQIIDRWND
ncbi:Chromosome partitioning protein, ParB family [Rivularia sp. IAM M-261]|nr:Chromosome partitioning protein, ParB family [Rivularia sp. IAM M-261]